MSDSEHTDNQQPHDLKPPNHIETIFDDFLGRLEEKLKDTTLDRNDVVRDTLYQIYLGTIPDFRRLNDYTYPIAARALLASFDPRNVSVEAEYYPDLDTERYYQRKPLLWFWRMFDRSPLGLNSFLGFKVRQLLAPYIFDTIGENLKCGALVQLNLGYNLTIGDDVVIGQRAVLDDRGGIEIGKQSQLGDFVTIYSHTPDLSCGRFVNKAKTVIGDGVRLGTHSTILPGVHIGNGAVVGPMSTVTRNVEPHLILSCAPAILVSPPSKGDDQKTS